MRHVLTEHGSGNEIGPFRALEESIIAHLTATERRSDIFAWCTLIGSLGAASGLMVGGWITTFLIETKNWNKVKAYRLIFFVYAVIGLLKLVLALSLSEACEAEKQPSSANATETAPLLNPDNDGDNGKKKKRRNIFPRLSRESQVILVQLCLLFAFDNFASGLAPMYVGCFPPGKPTLITFCLQVLGHLLFRTAVQPL